MSSLKNIQRPFSRTFGKRVRQAQDRPKDLIQTIARFEALADELISFGAGDAVRTIVDARLNPEPEEKPDEPTPRPPLDVVLKNAVVSRVASDGSISKNDVLAGLIGTVADILFFYSDRRMSLIDAHVFSFHLIARIEKKTGQTWRDVYGIRAEN